MLAPQVTSISPTNGPQAGGTIVDIFGINLGKTGLDIVSITLASVSCATYDYTNRLELIANVHSSLDNLI